jgi:hypothetical protein
MHVIIGDEVPDNPAVRHAHRVLVSALQHNLATLEEWEIVAVILLADDNQKLMVSFGLRSNADQKIRHMFGASPEGNPTRLEEVVAISQDAHRDARLFNQIMDLIDSKSSNKLH